MVKSAIWAALGLALFTVPGAFGHGIPEGADMQWAGIKAADKTERTELVNQGFSIENVVADTAYGFAPTDTLDSLRLQGYEVTAQVAVADLRPFDFPAADAPYHNYQEMNAALDQMVADFPGVAHKITLGKSLEGREIVGVRINPHAKDGTEPSGLPGIVIMGGHHAREHLSMEIPRMLAKHLLDSYGKDETIRDLMAARDIYFVPMINPDGAEFDIATGSYQHWRKNRRQNDKSNCSGVDLNRNYDYKWGQGGSSSSPCSDVYMGAKPFSEPETQAVKRFVETHKNLKILLTLHTYSELILYPWGHSYDPIANATDRSTYETMARTMAGWNGYTPQQSSDLYITTGDTVDWAYGSQGLFAFTFELSPRDMWGGGGFYPGVEAIEQTFNANLRPALYLIDLANDPYRAALRPETTLFYGRK